VQHVSLRVAAVKNWNFSEVHTLNIRTRCVSCVRAFVRACECLCVLDLLKSQLGATSHEFPSRLALEKFQHTHTHTHTHVRTYAGKASGSYALTFTSHESDLILLYIELLFPNSPKSDV